MWIPVMAAACGGELPPGSPPDIQVDVVPIGGLASGVRIAVASAETGTRVVDCRADDDRWLASRPKDAEITWYGLLLGTTYACTASIGDHAAPFSFATPAAPPELPLLTQSGQTTGYTLFNHVRSGNGQKLVIVDPLGRVRWYRFLEGDPNVGLEAAFLAETSVGPRLLVAGGEGYPPSLIALDGSLTWAGPPAGFEGGSWNHDALWRPEHESVVALSWSTDFTATGSVQGAAIEQIAAFTDASEWQWTTQIPYDRGQIVPSGDFDAYHANAIDFRPDDPDGPAYWVSLKAIHQVVRVDVASGDVSWRVGVGGDFALLEADGSPAGDDRWFYGQHAPESAPTADPDVFTLLVHDNGKDRPGVGEPFTRALELELDLPARTARITWEWTEPGWYEPVFGDVDRLADGHVLITQAHCPQCVDAPDRLTSFVEVDPASGAVAWRLTEGDPEDSGYRAERIDACTLFPENVTFCPDDAQERRP